MPLWIKIAGTWTRVIDVWNKVAGTWQQVDVGHVKQAAAWEVFHRPIVQVTISSNDTNVDLYVAAGSPAIAVVAEITIDSGVVLKSTSTGNAAVVLGNWPANSTIKIINNGVIHGMGGAGGSGDYFYPDISTYVGASAGSIGGDAIELNQDVEIDNTNGYIFGGGGGGGGGGRADLWYGGHGGGGAGGGAGGDYPVEPTIPASATAPHVDPADAGTDGLSGTGGAGVVVPDHSGDNAGDGGDGGGYGASGNAGTAGSGGSINQPGAAGGAAGKAIELGGFTVTWLGGNNSTQVKGAVS